MTKFEYLVLKGLVAIISIDLLLLKGTQTGLVTDFVSEGAKKINDEISTAIMESPFFASTKQENNK